MKDVLEPGESCQSGQCWRQRWRYHTATELARKELSWLRESYHQHRGVLFSSHALPLLSVHETGPLVKEMSRILDTSSGLLNNTGWAFLCLQENISGLH